MHNCARLVVSMQGWKHRKAAVLACALSWLILSSATLVHARSPRSVLLTDNHEPALPRLMTGATYTFDPEPTNPADKVDATDRAGQRLFDAGRPVPNWHRVIGWSNSNGRVTVDLQQPCRVESVEVQFMAAALPVEVSLSLLDGEAAAADGQPMAWREAVRMPVPQEQANLWLTLDPAEPVTTQHVRLDFARGKQHFFVMEVRVWGRPLTDDVSRVQPGDPGVLISGNAPLGAIVLPDNASDESGRAARLLQGFLERMTSVNVPVVSPSDAAGLANRVFVGPEAAAGAGVEIRQTYPGDERIVIRPVERGLVLAGNDELSYRGTVMAVTSFLEHLGARMYRYDDPDYLIIPTLDQVRIDGATLDETPAFASRWLLTPPAPGSEAHELYHAWNRLDGVTVSSGHNPFIPTEEFAQHPEYFSLVKGERRNSGEWQYCTTHPDVIRIAADKAAEHWTNQPHHRSYSLSPIDCGGYCECENCKAVDAKYGRGMGTRWTVFCNMVRADLNRRYPQFKDRQLLFYAYWYTKGAPESVRVAPGVIPMLCGDGCHQHLWDDPSCPPNVQLMKWYQGWVRATSDHVAVYEWYIPEYKGPRWERFPWVDVELTLGNLRLWRQRGSQWLLFQAAPRVEYWPYRWVTFYTVARGMWNPDLDPDALLTQLTRDCYGPAASTMKAYFQLLQTAQRANGEKHFKAWFLLNPEDIFTDASRAKAKELLEQSMALTADSPAHHGRVRDAYDAWAEGWRRIAEITSNPDLIEQGPVDYNPELKKK